VKLLYRWGNKRYNQEYGRKLEKMEKESVFKIQQESILEENRRRKGRV